MNKIKLFFVLLMLIGIISGCASSPENAPIKTEDVRETTYETSTEQIMDNISKTDVLSTEIISNEITSESENTTMVSVSDEKKVNSEIKSKANFGAEM